MRVPSGAMLSIGESSRLSGLSPDVLRRLCVKGFLTHERTVGGHYRILADSLERYMDYRAAERARRERRERERVAS